MGSEVVSSILFMAGAISYIIAISFYRSTKTSYLLHTISAVFASLGASLFTTWNWDKGSILFLLGTIGVVEYILELGYIGCYEVWNRRDEEERRYVHTLRAISGVSLTVGIFVSIILEIA